MSWGGGVFSAREQTAAEALAQGRPVLVVGPWGSGRSRFVHHLSLDVRRSELVTVTDVHQLSKDEVADLVEQLRRQQPAALTTARGATLRPELRRALAHAEVVELGRLTPEQAAAVARDRLGTEQTEQTEQDLHHLLARSGGILRLLEAVLDDGPILPGPALRSAVGELLDSLTRPERDVVMTLMCTGPVPVPIADMAFPARPVESLQADGLVAERDGEGVADLVLSADVLLEGAGAWVAPRGRRARLERVAAGVDEARLGELSLHQRVRVAGWATAAGPVHLVRQGVRPAVLVGDLDTAVELGRYVTARDPADRRTRETVVMALEASGHHSLAVSLARENSPDDESSRARLAANAYLSTLDESLARDLAPRSVTAGDDDDGEAAANLAWLTLFTGDVEDVTSAAAGVIAADSSSAQARVWSCVQYAVAEVVAGGASSLDVLDAAGRVVRARPDEVTPYSDFQVAWTRCVVDVRLGRAAEVLPVAAAAMAATDDPQLVAAWHGVAGLACRELSVFQDGCRHFEAIGDSLSGDPFGLGTWAASEHRVCSAMLGCGDGPPPGSTPIGFTEALVQRNEAWCVAVEDPAEARTRTTEAARLAHARGQSTHEMLALVDLARFGRPGTASARAAEVACVENPLVRAGGMVVSAMARRRVADLLDAARSARGVGWWVVRAELLVLVRHELVADGQPHAAALVEVHAGPSAWPTPILADDDTPRFVTEREREVGALAITGTRSDAIAARLGISRRTVDNLLGRLYHKCGVTGRAELTTSIDAIMTSARA